MKRNWLPQAIASGMLLWALNPNNPYGYYVLLHFVCFGIFVYLAVQVFLLKKQVWLWVLGITAIVYNPIFHLHFTREIWFVINIVTIGISVTSIFVIRKKRRRIRK